MLQGTIVENGFQNPAVLKNLKILKSWKSDDWNLHQIEVTREEAINLGRHLKDGPWYMHFWKSDKDDVLVVFKNKTFDIKHSDKSTWHDAIEYGKSVGIPEAQLDFVVN